MPLLGGHMNKWVRTFQTIDNVRKTHKNTGRGPNVPRNGGGGGNPQRSITRTAMPTKHKNRVLVGIMSTHMLFHPKQKNKRLYTHWTIGWRLVANRATKGKGSHPEHAEVRLDRCTFKQIRTIEATKLTKNWNEYLGMSSVTAGRLSAKICY